MRRSNTYIAIQHKYKMTKLNNPIHTGGAGRLAMDPEGCISLPQSDGQTLKQVTGGFRGGDAQALA